MKRIMAAFFLLALILMSAPKASAFIPVGPLGDPGLFIPSDEIEVYPTDPLPSGPPELIPIPILPFFKCTLDAQVTFSKEASDYVGSVILDEDVGSYKVVLYGKLLKPLDDLETIGEVFSVGGPYQNEKFFVSFFYQPTSTFFHLPAVCKALPGEEVEDSTILRCALSLDFPIPAGKTPEEIRSALALFEKLKASISAAPFDSTQCSPGIAFSAFYDVDASADADADGVPDSLDNCPDVPNYGQDATACAVVDDEGELPLPTTDPGLGNYVPPDGSGDVSDSTIGSLQPLDSGGFCSLAETASHGGMGLIVILSSLVAILRRRR